MTITPAGDPAPVLAYWFAAAARLSHGDGRPVVIGETVRVNPPLVLCCRGLHGSEHPLDALQYAPGPLLYRTSHSGTILRGHDKLCSTERTALAMIDATDMLRRYARSEALGVSHLWDAPFVVRKYLETGDEAIRIAAAEAAASAAHASASAAAHASAARAARAAASAAHASASAARAARAAASAAHASAWTARTAWAAAAWAAAWTDSRERFATLVTEAFASPTQER